jgi:hypothetical protein
VYTANAQVSQANDLTTNGAHLVQATSAVQPTIVLAGMNNRPAFSHTGGLYVRKTGLSVASSWTLAVCGQLTNPAAIQAIVGAGSSGSAPLIYTASSSLLSVNDAVNQINATATVVLNVTAATNTTPIQITTASPHGYVTGASVTIANVGGNTNANGVSVITVTSPTSFVLNGSAGNAPYTTGGTSTYNVLQSPFTCVVQSNGASSFIRLNGVQYNGTLSNITISDIYLGADVGGSRWDRFTSGLVAIGGRVVTSSEILNIEARWRSLYGTP